MQDSLACCWGPSRGSQAASAEWDGSSPPGGLGNNASGVGNLEHSCRGWGACGIWQHV